MNNNRIRRTVAWGSATAAAASVLTCTFAGPASAETKTLIDQNVVADCRGGDCKPVVAAFTATTGTQTVALTNPGNPEYDCARAVAEFSLDGKRLQSRFVGPNWEQPPFTINASPGQHSLSILVVSQSDCKTGDASFYGARLRVTEEAAPAAPAQQPPPSQSAPKQGPLVSGEPGVAGVTFHVTDRSGVASQCTYSSEGYTDSFGLPANGSFDLFVPAIRMFKTRTGTISCDNGTSTKTSVFY